MFFCFLNYSRMRREGCGMEGQEGMKGWQVRLLAKEGQEGNKEATESSMMEIQNVLYRWKKNQ